MLITGTREVRLNSSASPSRQSGLNFRFAQRLLRRTKRDKMRMRMLRRRCFASPAMTPRRCILSANTKLPRPEIVVTFKDGKLFAPLRVNNLCVMALNNPIQPTAFDCLTSHHNFEHKYGFALKQDRTHAT